MSVPFQVAGNGNTEVFDRLDTGDSERVERDRHLRFCATPRDDQECAFGGVASEAG